MARHRLIGWLDRGHQRAMDAIRSNPEAGMKVLPYAKSESARRQLLLTLAIVGLIGIIFGWIGALVALAIAVPLVWKLEQHHFFGHDGTDDTET